MLFAVLLTVCSSKQKEATHNETMIIKPSEFSEETKDLILEKAKFEDWETMYKNVWSRSEAALYMQWRVTESEAAARECIRKPLNIRKIPLAQIIQAKGMENRFCNYCYNIAKNLGGKEFLLDTG